MCESITCYETRRLNDFQTGLKVVPNDSFFRFLLAIFSFRRSYDQSPTRFVHAIMVVRISGRITSLQYGEWCMLEPFTGSTVLLALTALAAFAVAVIAIRIAIKLAVRVGIVAAVVLAALYATGTLGLLPGV